MPLGKLTDAARPTGYRLDVTVDPLQERFSGRVEIDVELASASNRIVLHGRNLAVSGVSARIGARHVKGTWQQADPTGIAVVTFPEVLPAGNLVLSIDYDAAFGEGPAGMFRVKVGDDWYSWTQFQSIDARAAFPSFDQPSFKTPFTVTLRTPPGLMAVSNAPEIATERVGGMDVHRFAKTLPLPTYLVAMMVGPFVVAEGEAPPTPQREQPLPLRIISTRQNAGQLDYALVHSKEIIALLESYFDDAFPYPKLDQITSPIMPGAMENAGADLYEDSILILDENSPVTQKRKFGMIVSHELGHQWFGDLVTPAWWDDIWLNESFAQWMGYRIGNEWEPELNIWSGALAAGFSAMDTDALTVGRPIRGRIRTNAEIDGAFDSITYGKGGHVVSMIAAYMGDDKFRDGVRRYMAKHRYGVATTDDFFSALAEAAGDERIVPAMQSFVDQQGVPLLTFMQAGEGWRVTQYRYRPLGSASEPTRWGVPMCVRRGAEKHCELLTERSSTFSIGGSGALIPNAGGAGYYRFELSERDWAALIADAPKLTGNEAQAVADSLAASITAGRARVSQLAALARALSHHKDSYASDAAVDAMAGLVRAGLVDTKGRWGWSRFRGKLYAKLLSKYGLDLRARAYATEDPERKQRRVQIVERLIGTSRGKKWRKTFQKAASAYLAGDRKALDPEWFDIAFNVHLDRTGEAGAKDLLERALASEDPVFRPEALHAVASSGIKPIARFLLYDFQDSRVRPGERLDFLNNIMFTRPTRDIGYDWLRENIDEISKAHGGIFVARRLPNLVSRFCSVEKAQEIDQTFRPYFGGTAGELSFDRVVESVRNCGILEQARGEEISADFADLR
ncbi:MAG: M1 family metallopeptidase [Novosphingobium sp.]|nr:M1 family metallopeptidase [Novosphingobium sp.]